VRKDILSSLKDVDPERLKLLPLDLTSEESIMSAAEALSKTLPKDAHSYIHTAFITGGVLHAEKNARELDLEKIQHSFQINVISHLLLIKHFSKFLPSAKLKSQLDKPSKWVHVSARVGSVSDNQRGGWYSYRSSKSALNQVIKTFDLQLKMQQSPAISVGVHPGTVRTALSEGYLDRTDKVICSCIRLRSMGPYVNNAQRTGYSSQTTQQRSW
jgi:NAD(P)-dependent dehydrogenase (short-subunit alcohol dehydrogenase family)